MTIVVLLQVIMIPFLGIFFFIKSLLKCVFFLECWHGEPTNRPFMHEVVERLKIEISKLNGTYVYQENEITSLMLYENSTSNKIETLTYEFELSQMNEMIRKFLSMSPEEMEYAAL